MAYSVEEGLPSFGGHNRTGTESVRSIYGPAYGYHQPHDIAPPHLHGLHAAPSISSNMYSMPYGQSNLFSQQPERAPDGTLIYYRDVPVEKIVEVPEVRVEYVNKEVEVPNLLDVPICLPRQVPVEQVVERNIPIPIDITTTLKFSMPQLKPKYTEVKVPVYVPRYIEVAVPTKIVQVNDFAQSIVPAPPSKNVKLPKLGNDATDGGTFQHCVDVLVQRHIANYAAEKEYKVDTVDTMTFPPEAIQDREHTSPAVDADILNYGTNRSAGGISYYDDYSAPRSVEVAVE